MRSLSQCLRPDSLWSSEAAHLAAPQRKPALNLGRDPPSGYVIRTVSLASRYDMRGASSSPPASGGHESAACSCRVESMSMGAQFGGKDPAGRSPLKRHAHATHGAGTCKGGKVTTTVSDARAIIGPRVLPSSKPGIATRTWSFERLASSLRRSWLALSLAYRVALSQVGICRLLAGRGGRPKERWTVDGTNGERVSLL
ncbi:hypothetical protein J2777_005918 [Paraburkholderia graminis]|nr:hypothetical protein [Paraburkholderia graminis]